MARKSSMRKYLKMLQVHWKEFDDALRDDVRYARLSEPEKEVKRKAGRPYQGLVHVLFAKWNRSSVLNNHLRKSLGEAVKIGEPLTSLVISKLHVLESCHKQLVEFMWYEWEQEVYYNRTDDRFFRATEAAAAAWKELDKLLLAVETKLNETKGADVKPPMTDNQKAVYDLLDALPDGDALMGTKIIASLKRLEIQQSTLTTHIIPFLKRHYGVKNQHGVGYYIDRNK